MKKFLRTKTMLLLVLIGFAIFNVIFWPICANHMDTRNLGCWLGYGFLCFGFILLGASTFIQSKTPHAAETVLPLAICSGIYFVVMAITNTIVTLVNSEQFTATIVINLIEILLYAAAFVICYRYFGRVNEAIAEQKKRMSNWNMMGVTVNGLREYTDDQEIRDAITGLYESVKYSSSRTTDESLPIEKEFEEQIAFIKTSLRNGADKESVLKAIRIAHGIIKTRNQVLMAVQK